MKKNIFLFILLITLVFSYINVDARSGCCSHHGGVTSSCRYGKIVCQDGTTSPTCACEGGTTEATTKTYEAPSYVYGCTDQNAINYNSAANKDDGSCIAKVAGCMTNTAINYNSNANVADGSCQFEETKTTTKKVKYKTKYVYSKIHKNKSVKRKGKNGLKEVTTKIVTDESGNVVSSEITNTKTLKKKVNKLVYTNKKSKVSK